MTKKRRLRKYACKYPECYYYDPKSKTYCCDACSSDHYDYGRLKKGKESSILRSCFKLVMNHLPFIPRPPFSAEDLDILAEAIGAELALVKARLGHLQRTHDDIKALQYFLLSKEKSERERKCGG